MSVIRYAVTPTDPRAHVYTVVCTVPDPDPRGQVFRLPAWIRGSYLVRDFAKHVIDARADCAGEAVAIETIDKSALRCAPCDGPLALTCTFYARDESVRKAWLDTRRGFFNGSALLHRVEGRENDPVEVEVRKPEDAECGSWKLATAMTPVRIEDDGFGLYSAVDYEDAIDHPFEMGEFSRVEFEVDGIPHAFVLSGRCEPDAKRLADDAGKICRAQRELFGHEPRLDRYLFLTRVLGSGYGGLEHRASAALVCARGDLPRPGQTGLGREYRGFLGLVSHEYFHLWNVKRIAPERFTQSDLSREAYSRDLWHYEGVTSYYDDLMLLRAGILDAASYLDVLAEQATRLQRTPGRRVQTLQQASFDSWIKFYQPDANTPNATVSYYVKGALVALCLDLHLRLHGTATLDDIMRALWERHGRTGTPVPEGGLERIAQEVSGLALQNEFDHWLRSTEELPLEALLAEFGVEAALRPALHDADPGGRSSGTAMGATLGFRLRPGERTIAFVLPEGPACRAGLSDGDTIIAMDGLKIAAGHWAQSQMLLEPGCTYRLHYFRGDELLAASVTAAPLAKDTWTFTLSDASGERLARRKAWLGA